MTTAAKPGGCFILALPLQPNTAGTQMSSDTFEPESIVEMLAKQLASAERKEFRTGWTKEVSYMILRQLQ